MRVLFEGCADERHARACRIGFTGAQPPVRQRTSAPIAASHQCRRLLRAEQWLLGSALLERLELLPALDAVADRPREQPGNAYQPDVAGQQRLHQPLIEGGQLDLHG